MKKLPKPVEVAVILAAMWVGLFTWFLLMSKPLGNTREPITDSLRLATNAFAWMLVILAVFSEAARAYLRRQKRKKDI